MKIETIFRKIPDFKNIVIDQILFEYKYPVLFTCRNEQDVYIFICCLVNADKIQWIGSKTSYECLIRLLENKITIRDAFLQVSEKKITITYDGNKVYYDWVKRDSVPENLLPTAGEYMDTEEEEYAEEIALFKERSKRIEYSIKPKVSFLITFRYQGISSMGMEMELDWDMKKIRKYPVKNIHMSKVALG